MQDDFALDPFSDLRIPHYLFYKSVRSRFSKKEKEILDFLYAGTTPDEFLDMGIKLGDIRKAVNKLVNYFTKWKEGQLDVKAPEFIKDAGLMPIEKAVATSKENKLEEAGIDVEALEEKGAGEEKVAKEKKSKSKKEKVDKTEIRMSKDTTTFKEIDKLTAEALSTLMQKNAELLNVMSRIGLLSTFALLQLGVVDRDRFVAVAETATRNPEALYELIKDSLDMLIKITNKETFKKVANDMNMLKAQVISLMLLLDDYKMQVEKYKEWLEDAKQIISYLISLIKDHDDLRDDFVTWLLWYMYAGKVVQNVRGEG